MEARMPKHEAISDDELVSAIDYEVSAADYEGQSEISEQRSEADLAYSSLATNGVFPNTGMSTVIINTLQPAVDTLTTYLTKLFCSDKETVVFDPTNQNAAQYAEMATKVVNHVIHKENRGYEVMNRWIKDAALHKNGIVKVVWDDSPTHELMEIPEISEEELELLIVELESEEDVSVKIVEESKESIMISSMDAEGNEIEIEQNSMSVTLRVTRPRNMPKIINVPPEEFLINEGATSINDDQLTRFIAHRQLMYVSDIMAMFPDAEEDLLYASSASGYLEHEFETDIRHFFDGTYDQNDYESTQPNLRQIEIIESWIRADRDGDGIAEWRHTFTVGRTLLMDEEWFGAIPLCSFTFFPIPHKFYGLGLWDKLRDYHKTRTALVRSAIDATVQANTFRLIADPDRIDTRDLKSGRPGIIRV